MNARPDKFSVTAWAERRAVEMSDDIKSYIDIGTDFESAVDMVFESSILAMPYKMHALSLCDGYHHEHKWTLDKITGKTWCYQCQKFK